MNPLPDSLLRAPVAHRALHDMQRGRPENSRAAIRAAIEAGYGIEIDLQLSADGRAMVFHDDDLERLAAGTGRVRERTAEELGGMDLLGGDEGIPSFAEILALVDGRAPLLVELKDQHGGLGATDGALERAAAADIDGYAGDLALMSFSPHMIEAVGRLVPDRARGLVTCGFDPAKWDFVDGAERDRLREIPDFERVGASFLSHDAADLDRPRVAGLKAQGFPALCWTVRSPEAEAQARRVADNVTFEGYLAELPP